MFFFDNQTELDFVSKSFYGFKATNFFVESPNFKSCHFALQKIHIEITEVETPQPILPKRRCTIKKS